MFWSKGPTPSYDEQKSNNNLHSCYASIVCMIVWSKQTVNSADHEGEVTQGPAVEQVRVEQSSRECSCKSEMRSTHAVVVQSLPLSRSQS